MIIQPQQLAGLRSKHHDQKIVLTSGTFDLFHVGHLRYLQAVKTFGNIVVVLLSGDERVKTRKGPTRPIYPEKERAEILDALKIVDYVILDPGPSEEESFYKTIITSLNPDMYVTDGPDPRFLNILDTENFVILPRVADTGKFGSTSAIIDYISKG
jgi:rfaE bifunctional protein nucleotidyltransferase chain/domain